MVSELLHRALYALPDVTLAVEGRSLRIVDVNRAGDTFGYTKAELTRLSLDALIDVPRADLLQCVAAADHRALEGHARFKDGTAARVSVRASMSAVAAARPCVLVVVSERSDQVTPTELAEACSALRAALATFERLVPVSSRGSAELSLAQYACLQVETELGWDPVERINGRYGLSAAVRAKQDQAWRARLEHDPGLRQEHASLVAQYREWFHANQGAGAESTVAGYASKPPPPGDYTVSAVDLEMSTSEPLPFKPPDVPDLSVEQYAALTVEMDANPNAPRQILELYGISSEATWQACEAHWAELLQADPALRKRWMRLAADLRGKLVKGPSSR